MKKAILKQEVERTFGRQLTETRDFEQLSHLFADQAAYARCAGSVCRL